MAAKRKNIETEVSWRGYVNVSLNDQENTQVDLIRENYQAIDLVESMDAFFEQGLSLKFSTKNEGESVNIACYNNIPGHPDAGLCLTAWAPDIYEAMILLEVKNAHLEGDWSSYKPSTRRRG